jgi:hypothetical protein
MASGVEAPDEQSYDDAEVDAADNVVNGPVVVQCRAEDKDAAHQGDADDHVVAAAEPEWLSPGPRRIGGRLKLVGQSPSSISLRSDSRQRTCEWSTVRPDPRRS